MNINYQEFLKYSNLLNKGVNKIFIDKINLNKSRSTEKIKTSKDSFILHNNLIQVQKFNIEKVDKIRPKSMDIIKRSSRKSSELLKIH